MTRSGNKQTEASGSSAALGLRFDCRHFLGDRPCSLGCSGTCENYEPMGHRILIIKLGALGDVIRTEALLPGLKDAYPQSQITWVSRANGLRMLSNNPLIDRFLEFNEETVCQLRWEQFDLLISLDKEPAPAALAMQVQARDKRGIGLTRYGTVCPLNDAAHYYFALGLSDHLKFHENQRTYQRLIYDALGLHYDGQRYTLYPAPANLDYAKRLFEQLGVGSGEQVVGLNTGAGSTFANKTFSREKFLKLARNLGERDDCRMALLGGPQEHETNEWLAKQLDSSVIHTGCTHSELDFAAIVKRCSAVVTGDTTAMHVAIALRIPVVALFGPTCPQEIDLYGRGVKIVSKIDCAPCYKRSCDVCPNCMELIGLQEIQRALECYLGPAPADRTRLLPIAATSQ